MRGKATNITRNFSDPTKLPAILIGLKPLFFKGSYCVAREQVRIAQVKQRVRSWGATKKARVPPLAVAVSVHVGRFSEALALPEGWPKKGG
jgi:hypothetical protein